MPRKRKPSQTEIDAKIWALVALVLGYNELAKKAEKLGEKVFFRLSRDSAEAELIMEGGKPILERTPYLLEIEVPSSMISVQFREQDIALMRATVEEWDRRQAL